MPSNMPDTRAINEALRRAREMQSRSAQQRAPESPPPPAVPESEPEHIAEEAAPHSTDKPPAQQPMKKPTSPLDFLMQDKERTLILALLILLSGEGNNTELLFALMYLLI